MAELTSGETKSDALVQALGNVESVLRSKPQGEYSREWDNKLDAAFKAAEGLGARSFDINEVQLKVADPEERQERFEDWIQGGLGGMTLDEAVKLRDEFNLKG